MYVVFNPNFVKVSHHRLKRHARSAAKRVGGWFEDLRAKSSRTRTGHRRVRHTKLR